MTTLEDIEAKFKKASDSVRAIAEVYQQSRFIEEQYVEDQLWDPKARRFVNRPDYLPALLIGAVIGAFLVLALVFVLR